MIEDPLADKGVPRGYDLEVRHLKERAVKMGEWALQMVHDGWEAFDHSDLTAARKVLDRNAALDRLDDEMEHATIAFLVLRQPTAVDLRTAAAVLKMTTHMDRIGRLGFDIARMTRSETEPVSSELHTVLQRMDETVESMVHEALGVLAQGRAEEARELFRRDDEVDGMHRQAWRLVVAGLKANPSSAPQLTSLLLVARHFERIADNACKIAEKTIYAVTGQRRAEYLPRRPPRLIYDDRFP